MKMNLDAFMILLSKDAAKNRMISFADIREAYRRTIAHGELIIFSLKATSKNVIPAKAGIHKLLT